MARTAFEPLPDACALQCVQGAEFNTSYHAAVRAFIAVTDPVWLRRLAAQGVREANFWQPRPAVLRQDRGTPWIFKVRGADRVGGYGFFSYYSVMPSGVAWETFGLANGVESYAEMRRRLTDLRHAGSEDDSVGCVVLSDLALFAPDEYVSAPADWKPNTVRGQYYDLTMGEGKRLWLELTAKAPAPVAVSALHTVPGGYGLPGIYLPRLGQGAFRLMVMDAYGRRCAITGDKTLPALDAAHIRPFHAVESHDVRNGILMRSDLHRLFDQGYVTVTPDLRFRVSSQIRDQFQNGLIYYDLNDRNVSVPESEDQRPDRSGLEWHGSTIFRP
jgi:putative restriction endonuclease